MELMPQPIMPMGAHCRKSMRSFVLLFALGLGGASMSQPAWAPVGIPFNTQFMSNIYADTIADALYFCGESSVDGDFNFSDQGVSVYRNGQWDTLGIFHGLPRCALRWRDTLLVGGAFTDINGLPMDYLAYFDSTNMVWSPYGSFSSASVHELRIIDDTLYALGAFDFADGNFCQGIARREGQEWTSVGSWDVVSNNIITDLVKYQGQLIACGQIDFTNYTGGDVAYFNGTEWLPLGPGLSGTWAAGRSLCEYQGDLYLGGSIDVNAGNAGHGIMRWDGSSFQPVGTGVFGPCNDYSCPSGVGDMKVHDGQLFVSGVVSYAGHVPAPHIATWDGVDWCGLPGDLRGPVECFEFFHDTLFAGPFHEAEGVDVWCGARFIGATYADTCTAVSTNVQAATSTPFCAIGPNPVSGTVYVQCPAGSVRLEGDMLFRLMDATGKEVWRAPLRAGTNILELDGMRAGTYLALIIDRGALLHRQTLVILR